MAIVVNPLTPPGPKPSPILGNLNDLRNDPLGFFTKSAQEYGDVVRFSFLGRPVYLLNRPDYIEQVLVTENANFIKGRGLRLNKRLFGNGLLTAEGDFWLKQRRLAQPAFYKERVNAYGAVMVEFTEQLLGKWQAGAEVAIQTEMMGLTLDVVAKTLFDADMTGKTAAVGAALGAILDSQVTRRGGLLSRLFPSLPTPTNRRYDAAVCHLEQIIYALIEQHRTLLAQGKDNGDLLSMLMLARDDDGQPMSDRQLRDEAITIFLAGHETTALNLTWTFYLLAQNRAVEEKLVAELQSVLAGRAPTIADLRQLPYTEKVISESMRLYPPAFAVGRQALKSFKLGGYTIPAGAGVLMSQWVTQRDPRYFEQPEQFNPDRWTAEMKRQLPKYAYFPFGGGQRLCIGNNFALMEAQLMLATIVQQYHLDLLSGQKIELAPAITLRPAQDIKMRLVQR